MKKNIFTLIFTCFIGLMSNYAQTVNDIPLKDINVDYMEIVGTGKFMSNKLTIEIDFGQENKYWSSKDTQLKDANGKLIVFNSMIDALNFFSANGYDFVTAYIVTVGSNNQNVYHYLLKKKK